MCKTQKKKNKSKNDFSKTRCPYCGGRVELRSAKGIYKTSLHDDQMLYVCKNYPECNSYVRCHKGTVIPVGELADENLRRLRKEAHFYFDRLYSEHRMGREDAYRWLSVLTGKQMKDAHIGCLNEYNCRLVIEKSKELLEFRMEHNIS